MKRIFSIFLTLILGFTTTTTYISANENTLNNPIAKSNTLLVNEYDQQVISKAKRIYNNEVNYITKYSTEEGIFETTVSNNLVTVRNENNEIVSAILFKTKDSEETSSMNVFNDSDDNISIAASDLAESYNVFRPWGETTTYIFIIEGAIPTLINLALSIHAMLTATAVTFLLVASVNSFVYSMYSLVTEHMEFGVKALVSYNRYCDILVKEQVTGEVRGKKYSGAINHNWLDSPWIYGVHPEACRYLTEIYA